MPRKPDTHAVPSSAPNHRVGTPLDAALRARVVTALAQDDASFQAIADRFSLSKASVGRIAQAEGIKRARPAQGVTLSLWLRAEDRDAVDACAGQAGFRSRSDFVRHVLRRAAGQGDVTPAEAAPLVEIAQQLRGIATNINQIARAGNAGRIGGWQAKDGPALKAQAAEAGALLKRIDALLADRGLPDRRAALEAGDA